MALADYGAYPGDDDPTAFFGTNAALTLTSQEIILGGNPKMRVVISVIGGSGAYINFATAATTGDYRMGPDSTFVYQGRPVTTVHILGVAASGIFSIHAN